MEGGLAVTCRSQELTARALNLPDVVVSKHTSCTKDAACDDGKHHT
jgi:hypothetical protein